MKANIEKMKNRYLFLFLAGAIVVLPASCTKNFRDINKSITGLTDDQANADFALITAFLAQAQRGIITENVIAYQLANNLGSDAFSGYFATQNPYEGNANNLTYRLVEKWNKEVWQNRYIQVMNPLYRVIELTREDEGMQDIYAFALLLRVAAMHRACDKLGPIIYSQYNIPNKEGGVEYDDMKEVYSLFFRDLETASSILNGVKEKKVSFAMKQADLAYSNDNYTHWVRFANTLRLRLAIRLAYIDPDQAKQEGEAALLAASGGLVEDNIGNCFISLSVTHPLTVITNDWSDTRMGAPMESIMTGYQDPRLPKYFQPAADPVVAGQYKGIRQGIHIDAKTRYDSYSKMASLPPKMQLMVAAETWFLKAEAALRGWANAGDAKTNYETGIRTSFEMFGLSDQATAYIQDAVSKPNPYTDPKAMNPGENDISIVSPDLSKISIQWEEAVSNDLKLERIITQKWIALFPDGDEAWAEYRRTGYPILFPVVVNLSAGVIPTVPGVRRLPYPQREYDSNSAATARAVELLGGPDNGGTRLWWDVPDKHF